MALALLQPGETSAARDKINAVITFLNAATQPLNMNDQNVLNVGVLQARAVFLNGSPISAYAKNVLPMSRTSNPLVWNLTMKDYIGTPDVRFGGLNQPQPNFAITGSATRLAVTNGSFELGPYSTWVQSSLTTITAVNPDGGTGVCAAIGSAGGYVYQVISGLTAGTVYTVTVRVRGDAGTTALAKLQLSNGGASSGTSYATFDSLTSPWDTYTNPWDTYAAGSAGSLIGVTSGALTTTWATLTLNYTADASGLLAISLVRSASGAGAVYFDNVTSSGGTAVQNAGFEAGNFAGWFSSEFGTTSINPYEASLCAYMYSPLGYFYQVVSGLTPGATYVISMWYRGDAGSAAQVSLDVHDGTGANQTQTPFAAVSTAWQQATISYTANSTGQVGIALLKDSNVGLAYFDVVGILGGYQSSTWTVTFLPNCQPYPNDLVEFAGDVLT